MQLSTIRLPKWVESQGHIPHQADQEKSTINPSIRLAMTNQLIGACLLLSERTTPFPRTTLSFQTCPDESDPAGHFQYTPVMRRIVARHLSLLPLFLFRQDPSQLVHEPEPVLKYCGTLPFYPPMLANVKKFGHQSHHSIQLSPSGINQEGPDIMIQIPDHQPALRATNNPIL